MSYGWAGDADTHAQRNWQEQMNSPDDVPQVRVDVGLENYPTTVSDETMAQWIDPGYRDQVRGRPLDQFVGVPAPILSRLLDTYAECHG